MKRYKIFLDDIREPPDNTWYVVRTVEECTLFINILACNNKPMLVSLDNDLGTEKEGYDVLKWFEEKMHRFENFTPNIRFRVHSQNNVAVQKMQVAIEKITDYLTLKILNAPITEKDILEGEREIREGNWVTLEQLRQELKEDDELLS